MEVIYSLKELKKLRFKTGVSLGTFDGLHRGHQALINQLKKNCRENNYKSVVYTFSNHPREITSKDNIPKKILNNKEKIKLFEETGIDYLVFVEFDKLHSNIEATDFVEKILINKLNLHSMIVGFDCRFGKNGKGNIESLKNFSNEYQFDLKVVSPIKVDNEIVSSTLIRKLLTKGLITKANHLLGRNYTMVGEVIKGKQVGSKLGFPTANIKFNSSLCLPKPGVYITKTYIEDKVYLSVTNVGFNPTFNQKNYNIETYIFDFNYDIYDKEIKIEFLKHIRDEFRFPSIEALCKQMDEDIKLAKNYFLTHQ